MVLNNCHLHTELNDKVRFFFQMGLAALFNSTLSGIFSSRKKNHNIMMQCLKVFACLLKAGQPVQQKHFQGV